MFLELTANNPMSYVSYMYYTPSAIVQQAFCFQQRFKDFTIPTDYLIQYKEFNPQRRGTTPPYFLLNARKGM
jgi:hypothetical protein